MLLFSVRIEAYFAIILFDIGLAESKANYFLRIVVEGAKHVSLAAKMKNIISKIVEGMRNFGNIISIVRRRFGVNFIGLGYITVIGTHSYSKRVEIPYIYRWV